MVSDNDSGEMQQRAVRTWHVDHANVQLPGFQNPVSHLHTKMHLQESKNYDMSLRPLLAI